MFANEPTRNPSGWNADDLRELSIARSRAIVLTPTGTPSFSAMGAEPAKYLAQIGARLVSIGEKGESYAVRVELSGEHIELVAGHTLFRDVRFEKNFKFTGRELDGGRIELADISGISVSIGRFLPLLFPQSIEVSSDGRASVVAETLGVPVRKVVNLPVETLDKIRESVRNFKTLCGDLGHP